MIGGMMWAVSKNAFCGIAIPAKHLIPIWVSLSFKPSVKSRPHPFVLEFFALFAAIIVNVVNNKKNQLSFSATRALAAISINDFKLESAGALSTLLIFALLLGWVFDSFFSFGGLLIKTGAAEFQTWLALIGATHTQTFLVSFLSVYSLWGLDVAGGFVSFGLIFLARLAYRFAIGYWSYCASAAHSALLLSESIRTVILRAIVAHRDHFIHVGSQCQ